MVIELYALLVSSPVPYVTGSAEKSPSSVAPAEFVTVYWYVDPGAIRS